MRLLPRPNRGAAVVVGVALALGIALAGCAPGEAPTPLPSFSGAEASLTAENLVYAPLEVRLPADTPLRVLLDNRDAGTPHDVAVRAADGTTLATSPVINGIATTEVRFGPLAAGTYRLVCTIHPAMAAVLVVDP